MVKLTTPLETATRKKIDQMLINLGWNIDEDDPNCNVFTERAKTVEQDKKFGGDDPDYVLYQSNSDHPIAIIEAKRKGQNVDDAIFDAVDKYAKPLGIKIIFAYDGAFFKSWHVGMQKELYLDGEVVSQLVTEKILLRFVKEGSSISEVSPKIKHSRSELINTFKWANDMLRKEGL
ncbi:MAG: restriction endonuclease subunit M, partial [Thaumarchaeota archaeon]|nr:restriction endonuclease subunit M [Nitrososphaerota archaeon]